MSSAFFPITPRINKILARRKSRRFKLKILTLLVTFGFVFFVLFLIGSAVAFGFFARELPSPNKLSDKNFYKHKGFDPVGYIRAVREIAFDIQLQGGSTLTQQLVKNTLLSSERTITRKIKEFILSVQIERRFSKDEILQMYLN